MKIKEVIQIITDFAPMELSLEGDNIGIQVGNDVEREVYKIGIALDPSMSVIKKSIDLNVDFLFTHHPILKDKINNFNGLIYDKLRLLIKNDIFHYSAHTNLDICNGGLNDALCELYGLNDIKPLYENGLGRYGEFKGTIDEIISITKKFICNTPTVINREIVENKKSLVVGVLSGYGLSQKNIEYVSHLCDVYISGDLTHHSKILSEDLGLCVIDGGHYGTEVYGLKKFMNYLKSKLDLDIVSLDF